MIKTFSSLELFINAVRAAEMLSIPFEVRSEMQALALFGEVAPNKQVRVYSLILKVDAE